MEPGHEDREYEAGKLRLRALNVASMEPGHEDREYPDVTPSLSANSWPQWSPVMKTGNTGRALPRRHRRRTASMEPGHEDREYSSTGTFSQALT